MAYNALMPPYLVLIFISVITDVVGHLKLKALKKGVGTKLVYRQANEPPAHKVYLSYCAVVHLAYAIQAPFKAFPSFPFSDQGGPDKGADGVPADFLPPGCPPGEFPDYNVLVP